MGKKNKRKNEDPKDNYPEINFDRLEEIAADWSKKYPYIEQITFYPHNPESFGEGKRGLIDIILDERIVKDQFKDMKSPISLNELLDAQNKDNNLEKKDCNIYFRFRGAVLPTSFISDIEKNVLLFEKIPKREKKRGCATEGKMNQQNSEPSDQSATFDLLDFIKKNSTLHINPNKVVYKRNKKAESDIWHYTVWPLIELHHPGKIKYTYNPKPLNITEKNLLNIRRKMSFLCYDGPDLIFPTHNFEKEVMMPLYAGAKKISRQPKEIMVRSKVGLQKISIIPDKEPINLKIFFFDFLKEVINNDQLPIFLWHLYDVFGESTLGDGPLYEEAPKNKFDLENDLAISWDKGLEWKNLKVTFLGEDEIHFQYKQHRTTRRFDVAGFKDNRRTGLPIKSWYILMGAAKNGGEINFNFQNRKNIEKYVQKLRKIFQNLFPTIPGDPIPFNKKIKRYSFCFLLIPPAS